MATSGTIAGSFSGSGKAGQKPYIFWERTSYSIANNTSTIKVTFKVKRIGTSYSTNKSSAPWSITIAGSKKSGTKDYKISSVGSGSYVTIGSYSKTISHNADGKKDVTLKASIDLSGTTAGTGSVSGTVTLDQIPRVSEPTASAYSVTTGGGITIYTNRKSSSFTHRITYTFNGATYTLSASAGDSVAFYPPHTLFAGLPGSTAATATITVTTLYGSTTIGSRAFNVTVYLNGGVVPSIGTITLSRVAAAETSGFTSFVQGYDRLRVQTAAAVYAGCGGSISSITCAINGKVYSGADFTTDALTTAGTFSFTVVAADTRGRSISKATGTITVVPYEAPKITLFEAFRASSATSVTEDRNGVVIRTRGAWKGSDIDGKNALKAKLEVKLSNAETFSPLVASASQNTYYTLTNALQSKSYIIRLTVVDAIGREDANDITVMSAAKNMSFLSNGKGIAIGKYAEREGLDVAIDTIFSGEIYIEDPELEELWSQIIPGGGV